MSTDAFRATLVREIKQAMDRAQENAYDDLINYGTSDYLDGQMEAYAHILTLIMDEDL
jgi:ABC-type transport system involved in Fe-S cluster assembly fused permease/ATPase subunit